MTVITDGLPRSLTLRSAIEDDWPSMYLLAATSFPGFTGPRSVNTWRSLIPADGAVVVCDGGDVVGMALYLDLRLTVPGGAVLSTAGLSFVAVAPTHRRRGLLRALCAELHRRINDSGYSMAALYASEGGIYGRFGYGPATITQGLTVERRIAGFHADAPDPGGVRLVSVAQHRDRFAEIYQRWRQQIPGGLVRPDWLWGDLLGDYGKFPRGGSKWFALLHDDGYALYRVDDTNPTTAQVDELRALTPEAHSALWRALLGLDAMEKVNIITHVGDSLPYLLADARVARTTAHHDGLWLRIMNVPAALEARGYDADLSTVLAVFGVGRFALDIHDGQARCIPTDAPADIEMTRAVLGSLYLGAHRAPTLAAANRLHAKDSHLVRRLDAAFASDSPAAAGFEF